MGPQGEVHRRARPSLLHAARQCYVRRNEIPRCIRRPCDERPLIAARQAAPGNLVPASRTAVPLTSRSEGMRMTWSAVTEPRQHFDAVAIVPSDGDRHQFRGAVAHDANAQTLAAEQQGVRGDGHRLRPPRQREMDEHIGTGQQFLVRVVHVHLDQQRSRRGVDRVVGPHKSAVKDFARDIPRASPWRPLRCAWREKETSGTAT